MTILTTGNTFADGDQVTSTKLNNIANAATFASGAVDDSTTQLSSGAIIVKDLGISTGKLAASAVTTAKITDSNVTTAKIAAANITTSLIADSNVTKAKIEDLANYKVLGNVSGGAAAPAEVAILDEDDMVSDSATSLATQQSIKAYVDTQLTAEDLDFAGDTGTGSVDLDSQTFTIAGATGLDTTASSQTLTVALDLNELTTETTIAQDDFVIMVDNTDSGNGKITFSNLEDEIFGNVSGDILIAAGGAATIQPNSVALGTDTTGNYVQSVTNGSYITGGDGGSESAALTLAVDATSTNTASKVVARDASGNFAAGTITAALTGNVTGNVTGNLTGDVTGDVTGNVTGNLTGNVTGNVTGDLTGNVTATSVLANGVTATTQTSGDNSTKVATTAYVDAQVSADGGWTLGADSGTDHAILPGETVDFVGTASEIETSVSGNTLTIGLPDDVTIAGNLTVNGTTTTVNTQTLSVEDPLIELANQNAANSVDVGLYGDYSLDAGVTTKYAGLFKDASDSDKFKLFKGLEVEPTTTVNTAGTGYTAADLVVGGLEASDDVNFDSGTFFVDASADRVGIGTTSPDHKLSVFGDSSGNRTEIGIDNIDQRLVLGAYFETGVTQYSTIQATNNAESSGTNLVLQPDGGNVGIGTTSPSTKLNVVSSTNAGIAVNDGTVNTILYNTSSANGSVGTTTNHPLAFYANNGEKMRLLANGNLGIGTASPSVPLQVDATGEDGIVLRNDSANNLTPLIEVRGQRTDTNSSQACGGGLGLTRWAPNNQIVDGNTVGSIYFGGAHGASTGDEANILYTASIKAEADETWSSASDMATDLVFRTGSTGRAYAYNLAYGDGEVMRLTHEGNVGIGTTSPGHTLDVSGEFRVNGGGSGSILVNDEDSSLCPTMTFLRNGGGTTTNDFIKFENSGGEVAAINSSGGGYFSSSVGIGTTSPEDKIDVVGNIRISANKTASTNKTGRLRFEHYDTAEEPVTGMFMNAFSSTNELNIGGGTSIENATTAINFYTAGSNTTTSGTERMTINASGNVGIGTASPSNTLHVENTTSSGAYINYDGRSNGEFGLRIESNADGGNFESDFAAGGTALLDLYANSATVSGGDLLVARTQSATPVLLVKGNGNIGIGETSPDVLLHVGTGSIYQNKTGTGTFPGLSDTTSHGCMIESQGSNGSSIHVSRVNSVAGNFSRQGTGDVLVFRNTSGSVTEAGSVEITGASSVAYRTSSDYRLKENVVDVTDGIDRVKQLNPVRFNFIGEDPIVDGFLAHEVQDIVPEAISGTKDGMKEEEYIEYPPVYDNVVHPAVEAVYEDVVHPATYEEVVHPAVEATYDEDGNELTPAQEEWTEQVLLTEEYTEQVLVTEAQEEWTERVLVSEAVMGTRSVPDYQGIDQSKLVPLLTAALQEAVAKIEALEARVQTLEG